MLTIINHWGDDNLEYIMLIAIEHIKVKKLIMPSGSKSVKQLECKCATVAGY